MPMKNCDKFKRLMSDFLEGELKGTLKSEFEAHLKACRTCEEALSRIRNVRAGLRRLSSVKTSPDFDAMLRARIRLMTGRRWRRSESLTIYSPWRIPAYALAVVTLAFVATMAVTMLTNPTSENNANVLENQFLSESQLLQRPAEEIPTRYILDHIPAGELFLGQGVPLNSENFRNDQEAKKDSVRRLLESNENTRVRVAPDIRTVAF